MPYGTENYAERERAAWQAGDHEKAGLLGLAADRAAELAEHEAEIENAFEDGKVEGKADMKQDFFSLLDNLGAELDASKRLGNRAGIERALQHLYKACGAP